MSTSIKVVVVGATGRTGESVVEGLLDSDTDFVSSTENFATRLC